MARASCSTLKGSSPRPSGRTTSSSWTISDLTVARRSEPVGARLFFLLNYFPDLNPIEMFFAKLKHWLRKAARRSVDAVYNAISEILPLTTPAECSNYFAQAGYAQLQSITL